MNEGHPWNRTLAWISEGPTNPLEITTSMFSKLPQAYNPGDSCCGRIAEGNKRSGRKESGRQEDRGSLDGRVLRRYKHHLDSAAHIPGSGVVAENSNRGIRGNR